MIVERHDWETGGHQQQLQFLLDVAADFFGAGNEDRKIVVRVFALATSPRPSVTKRITVSREYANGTRRTNGFPEMGDVPSSFVVFEETDETGVYDVWWQKDKAVIAARYRAWSQGHNTQHGRGRLSIIVNAPVPRVIDRID
ncbi:MAG: hypothetical protein HYX68_20885 [Planctomycetes bacterium]|nr:hypothetical protein [Planctomycetota bacterium]